MSRLKKFAANTALVVFSLSLSFAAAEIFIRVMYPRYDPSGHIAFPNNIDGVTLGPFSTTQRMIKNTGDYDVEVRFNEAGFRDSTLSAANEDDLYAVGDSFTFGWGVPEEFRFSNLLARHLGERVRNLATPTDVPGYGVLIEWGMKHGARPRRLVVGLCMENDVYNYDLIDWRTRSTNAFHRLKLAISAQSALYFVFTSAVHQSPRLRRAAQALGLSTDNVGGMFRDPYDRRAIEVTVERLQRVTAGFDATILMIPSRALWVGSPADRAGPARIHEEVAAKLRAAGYRLVDVRSALEAGGDPMRYSFRYDGHWNTAGHAVAARLLADALRASAREDGQPAPAAGPRPR